jgi:hypothetical protein
MEGVTVHIFDESFDELESWIRDEVCYPGTVGQGDHDVAARRVQEWLTLHGFGLAIDGDFGPVTARQLRRFQADRGLPDSGSLDQATHTELSRPMVEVLRQRSNGSGSVGATTCAYANAHLAGHPRELGGVNRGPWVRLYMQGHDGPDWPWCAGFVRFVLAQACDSLQVDRPVPGSESCDVLAAQGKAAGLFVPEAEVEPEHLPPGSIFLVRRSVTDWTHAGILAEAHLEGFDTIEGNTNDDGDREGHEVTARLRGYAEKDFIAIA